LKGEQNSVTHSHFQFHFANILSPWIRRALVAGGFGLASGHRDIAIEVAPVVSQHDSYEKGGDTSPSALKKEGYDLESPDADRTNSDRVEPIVSPDTPYFHFDLTTAVKSAEDVARGGETKGLAG
jgi:solute carrier family 26 (sodium-independent sulfate anion transporter), member 11